MTINICFSCDDNYAQHMAAAMASILHHAKDDTYRFYVLDGGISAKNKQRIESIKQIKEFDINFININYDDFKNCPITGYVSYISKPTYFRFKIPSLLQDVDRVLYLDCDIIALKDVADLFFADLDGKCIGAIPDTINDWHKERLGMAERAGLLYCNAGVMLFDNKRCREMDIEKKLFAFAENPDRKITFQDQDVINVVLAEEIKYLPIKWNLMHDAVCTDDPYPHLRNQHTNAINSPSIIHFTNSKKPWHYNSKSPYTREYLRHLAMTPFAKRATVIAAMQLPDSIISKVYNSRKTSTHKVIEICGLKIKLRRKHKALQDIENEIASLKSEFRKKISELENKNAILSEKLRDIDRRK